MLNEILERPHARRLFATIVIVLVPFALLVRYVVIPCLDPSIKGGWYLLTANVLDGFVVSLLVTILIGAFLFVVTPEIVRGARIEIREPRDLNHLFERSFPTADFWWYKGGCGRYFRSTTLPKMATLARKNSLSREIRAIILDPLNEELCRAHARFRRSTAAGKTSESWNLERVRHELYATIAAVLVTQANEPMLRITLSLAAHYSAFRIDLSNQSAIITKEDRSAPAIVCSPDNYYYKSYKEEVTLTESQCRQVEKLSLDEVDLKSITAEQVEDIISRSTLAHEGISSTDYEKIAAICRSNINPYA